MRSADLKASPDLGAMMAALDKFERDSMLCTCAWDGSPDATVSQIVDENCPVHGEEAQ